MAFTMTDSQKNTLTLGFKDRRGNPTSPPALSSPPQWLTSNSELLAVTPSADGLSCDVAAVGPLGTGTVSVKSTDDAHDFAGSVDVTVVAGAAATVDLTPGTPTEQP